jgi:putative FmdB family regulatory protein
METAEAIQAAGNKGDQEMPLLDLKCRSCGKAFEYLKSGTSDIPECPSCQSKEVTRLLSTFAVSAGGSSQKFEGPSCSGDPGSCGRCGMADA